MRAGETADAAARSNPRASSGTKTSSAPESESVCEISAETAAPSKDCWVSASAESWLRGREAAFAAFVERGRARLGFRVTAGATFLVVSRVGGAAGGGAGGGEDVAAVGVVDWGASGCGDGAGGGGGGGGGVTRVAFFGFGSGFGGGGGLGSGAGEVVVAAVLGVVVGVVSPVVTCCGEAWPARAAEDANPSAQRANRASVASPSGRERGGAAPAPNLIGRWRATPVLSAGEEEEMTPVRNSLVSATNVDRLRVFANRKNPRLGTEPPSLCCRRLYVVRRNQPPATSSTTNEAAKTARPKAKKSKRFSSVSAETMKRTTARPTRRVLSPSRMPPFSTSPGEHLPTFEQDACGADVSRN